MREKYCWLAGGWKLVLKQCERKTLLGWMLLELPNKVMDSSRILTKVSGSGDPVCASALPVPSPRAFRFLFSVVSEQLIGWTIGQ